MSYLKKSRYFHPLNFAAFFKRPFGCYNTDFGEWDRAGCRPDISTTGGEGASNPRRIGRIFDIPRMQQWTPDDEDRTEMYRGGISRNAGRIISRRTIRTGQTTCAGLQRGGTYEHNARSECPRKGSFSALICWGGGVAFARMPCFLIRKLGISSTQRRFPGVCYFDMQEVFGVRRRKFLARRGRGCAPRGEEEIFPEMDSVYLPIISYAGRREGDELASCVNVGGDRRGTNRGRPWAYAEFLGPSNTAPCIGELKFAGELTTLTIDMFQ